MRAQCVVQDGVERVLTLALSPPFSLPRWQPFLPSAGRVSNARVHLLWTPFLRAALVAR